MKPLVRSGIDVALTRAGYDGPDLDLARRSVVAWGRARTRSVRGGVGGLQVVVTRPGRVELLPFEVPMPAPDEVTVEVLVSGVSPGTERAQWLRLPNARPDLPFVPGYSGVGRVLAAGQAAGAAVGALVAVPRAKHASVATVPAAWVVPVPDGVPLDVASLTYLAIISGYGVRRSRLRAGEPLCVIGSGPIGALAQRLALLTGAGRLTVVATSRRHEAAALAAGASAFRLVGDGLADLGAPVVIEATGDPDAVRAAVTATRDGGTIVLLGSPRGRTSAVPLAEVQRRGLRLVGAHVSALATEVGRTGIDTFGDLAATYLRGLGEGRFDVADLAGAPVDPREIGLFYRRLARGEVGAGHLDWRKLPVEDRVRRRGWLAPPLLRPNATSIAAAPAAPARTVARRLRMAVIGCGDIGMTNARSVARATNAELVLVHDTVPALAEATAAQHGGTVVPVLDDVLDRGQVDAVVLSVPHDMHAPLAVRAIEAGLHVVVEKPLAVDVPSAERIVEAAERSGVVLSVCFPFRYEPAPVAARALVQAGALGRFRGAAVVFHADKPASYWLGGFSGRAISDWRSSRERAGGGVLIMNLTHHLDLIRHVARCEIETVSATARTDDGADVEDSIAVTVTFRGGGIGTLLGSASTRGKPGTRFEMWGEDGTIQLEPDPRLYTDRALPGVRTGRWNALPVAPAVDERRVYLERFAAAVLAGAPPDITAADGMAVQACVDGVYRSARAGGVPVWLDALREQV
jgi:2-desacetyl-2-hydroxyethyl bacteriochlorophyllide A dehydrogenase